MSKQSSLLFDDHPITPMSHHSCVQEKDNIRSEVQRHRQVGNFCQWTPYHAAHAITRAGLSFSDAAHSSPHQQLSQCEHSRSLLDFRSIVMAAPTSAASSTAAAPATPALTAQQQEWMDDPQAAFELGSVTPTTKLHTRISVPDASPTVCAVLLLLLSARAVIAWSWPSSDGRISTSA